MSEVSELSRRIEVIESGYEFLLAYAAQGRRDETGSDVRQALTDMYQALEGLGSVARQEGQALSGSTSSSFEVEPFFEALERDSRTARAAIGLVLGRPRIPSLLIDNLNASVHLRALLTDLFLLDQALKSTSG